MQLVILSLTSHILSYLNLIRNCSRLFLANYTSIRVLIDFQIQPVTLDYSIPLDGFPFIVLDATIFFLFSDFFNQSEDMWLEPVIDLIKKSFMIH